MLKSYTKTDHHNDRKKRLHCVCAVRTRTRMLRKNSWDLSHNVEILFSLVLQALLSPKEMQQQFHDFCIYKTIVVGQPTSQVYLRAILNKISKVSHTLLGLDEYSREIEAISVSTTLDISALVMMR